MKLPKSLISVALLASAGVASAASSWGFDEAKLSVSPISGKGQTRSFEEKLSKAKSLSKPVSLSWTENLKILITTTDGGKPRQAHQTFLTLKEPESGLETSFPFESRESGKGLVQFSQKDLPIQFLQTAKPLQATLVIASFGASQPYSNHAFDLSLLSDPNAMKPTVEKPLRYGKLPEINHIFRADPKSGPVIISIFFVLAILASVPILLGSWLYLGANLNHLQQAISTAPISHSVFFGSIISMEGIFFLYYYSWTLFQMLPVAGAVGLVAFLSGSKALSEVQSRRQAGLR